MTARTALFAVAVLLLGATSHAWAATDYCANLNAQVDSWEAYLLSQGAPQRVDAAGVLAFGKTVTNGNDRAMRAAHKTDVSTIFVVNPAGDFIRVVTSVPVGVARSRQPAVGTTLTYGGPAWTALNAGTSYCATVTLFGTNYDSLYRPIFAGGVVVGALYVGNTPRRRTPPLPSPQ
jgi:hypothetical protein